MLKTKNEIKSWLNQYKIESYFINDNLTVNVNGSINLSYLKLIKIPIKFNRVNGNFFCAYNELTSLEFFPSEIKRLSSNN
jgi:hypothetical protein